MRVAAALLVLIFMLASAAQAEPMSTKSYKSEEGTCQVTVPSDWSTSEFTATDANRTMSLVLTFARDAKVEVESDEFVRQVYGATKIFENTAQRLFVEGELPAFGPNPSARKWESLVPASPDGACRVVVTLNAGASEDTARLIVMSLGQAQ